MKRNLLLFLLSVCFFLPDFAATGQYNFIRVDGESGLSNSHVKSIIQDSYGFIWLGTRNGLNRYDGVSMKLYNCYDETLQHGNQVISALFEDNHRQLWIGTDDGVYIQDLATGKFSFFDARTESGEQIRYNWIEDILADHSGNIWVNAPNQGVFRYQVETGKLFRYIPCPGKDKSKDFPQSICVDKDGTIWVGTYGAGIYRYSPEQDKFVAYATEALKGDFIFTLCDYGDELIVGVHEEELKRFNKKTGEVSVFPAPEVHRKIIRYAVCFGDELWVGTQNGVYVINEKQNSVQHIPADAGGKYGLGDAIVDKIYRDREGGTWICTQFGGASYLPVRSLDFSVYLPGAPGTVCGRRISELAEGKDGTVWISTQDGGVCYWNPKAQAFVKVPESPDRQNVLSLFASDDLVGAGYFKGGIDLIIPGTASFASSSTSSSTFSSLTSSSTVSPVSVASSAISTTNIFRGQVHTFYPAQLGISEGSVFALYRDRGGVIWLGDGWNIFRSTDKGRTFEKMEQFGYAYMRDILEDKSGNIWVATMGNGIFRYNPQIVRRNTFVPPVYITGMYVQGRETPFPADGVQLPYRSNVGFDFVALSYTSPGANRYAYKMEGIDNDWNYTSAAHTASYAQLPPGDYLFRVRGSNNDGVWNQEEATLSVRILPPWWRTVWAYLIYIIVVSGSFVLTLRAYRRREVQKIREQQLLAELARERESHRTHEMFINQITYGACTPQGDAMSRADEQLMSQLIAKVRENLSDANYNVEALAAAMNMSRSSLHRKIKALTDLSSLDFIRIIRLKHAAELLQEGELRINEICDRVGFQSPSYFAKVFQKQFGVTPTEFAQQNKQRMTDS